MVTEYSSGTYMPRHFFYNKVVIPNPEGVRNLIILRIFFRLGHKTLYNLQVISSLNNDLLRCR